MMHTFLLCNFFSFKYSHWFLLLFTNGKKKWGQLFVHIYVTNGETDFKSPNVKYLLTIGWRLQRLPKCPGLLGILWHDSDTQPGRCMGRHDDCYRPVGWPQWPLQKVGGWLVSLRREQSLLNHLGFLKTIKIYKVSCTYIELFFKSIQSFT